MAIEIKEPEKITEITISEETKEDLKQFNFEEGQVTIYCIFAPNEEDYLIRIWKTTFLIDEKSSHKSNLLHIEDITFYPEWTPVAANTAKKFTLIFSRLPSTCAQFNLLEDIPQSGGFFYNNIQRNGTDIYTIRFNLD
jgi:hypothetical protein